MNKEEAAKLDAALGVVVPIFAEVYESFRDIRALPGITLVEDSTVRQTAHAALVASGIVFPHEAGAIVTNVSGDYRNAINIIESLGCEK